jgi:hypothetical protein
MSSDGTHVKLTYQDDDVSWVLLYHLVGIQDMRTGIQRHTDM